MRLLIRLSPFFVASGLLSGTDFSIRTVDGLSRPLAGVRVQVRVFCESGERSFLSFQSDKDGIIHGSYDERICKPSEVSVGKDGYESYYSGFREQYILERQFSAEEAQRIIKLDGDYELLELRELLAGADRFDNLIFYNEAHVRPALRILVRDPEVTTRARDLLATIAVPEDLHLILQLPPPPPESSAILPDRWRYWVVTALIGADTEDEWSFLEACAQNEFDDRWVDNGAIQTLRLTGTPRSRQILEQIRAKNPERARLIDRTLDYLKTNSAALAGPDLEALAKQVAHVLNIGTWEGNHAPRFNQAGDKALVDLTFATGADYLVYTATFHRINGTWILRGARETVQGFAPGTITRKQK